MPTKNIVHKRALAEFLGVAEKTLTIWQKEDPPLPAIERGGRGSTNTYDTVAVVQWLVDRAIRKAGHESAKDRLARVQADMVEVQLAEKRGLVTPTANIKPAWAGFVLAARDTLRSFPITLAPQLAVLEGVDAMRDLLSEQVDAVLNQLADGKS